MVAQIAIRREDHATIGRYALDVKGQAQPAIISYTRPRKHVIYVTYVRTPKGKPGAEAARLLAARVVEDARRNGDRIVLVALAAADLFASVPGWGDTVVAA